MDKTLWQDIATNSCGIVVPSAVHCCEISLSQLCIREVKFQFKFSTFFKNKQTNNKHITLEQCLFYVFPLPLPHY